jgi:predicted nucleotidyltransferase
MNSLYIPELKKYKEQRAGEYCIIAMGIFGSVVRNENTAFTRGYTTN